MEAIELTGANMAASEVTRASKDFFPDTFDGNLLGKTRVNNALNEIDNKVEGVFNANTAYTDGRVDNLAEETQIGLRGVDERAKNRSEENRQFTIDGLNTVNGRIDENRQFTVDGLNTVNGRIDELSEYTDRRFDRANERIDSIGAMAMANMAAAANATNRSCDDWRNCVGSLSMGVGHFEGETAGAVMYSRPVSSSARFSLGATYADGEVGSSLGFGFDF